MALLAKTPPSVDERSYSVTSCPPASISFSAGRPQGPAPMTMMRFLGEALGEAIVEFAGILAEAPSAVCSLGDVMAYQRLIQLKTMYIRKDIDGVYQSMTVVIERIFIIVILGGETRQ